MARETKAQRLAREEAERTMREENAKNTYSMRMMAVLRRAAKQNFELTVSLADKFLVSDRDNAHDYFYLSPEWSRETDQALYDLELSVELKEEAERERNRKAEVRANALAKLTAEERELLKL